MTDKPKPKPKKKAAPKKNDRYAQPISAIRKVSS